MASEIIWQIFVASNVDISINCSLESKINLQAFQIEATPWDDNNDFQEM